MSGTCDTFFDPLCDVPVDNCDDVSCVSNGTTSSTTKLEVLLKDLHKSETQSVNLAVVYNYNKNEVKDDIYFFEIKLGEIKLSYDTLVKVFFNDARKGFSPLVLGKIWQGVKNFSLAAIALEKFEEKTGISRNEIPSEKKVKLYKECAFPNLNSVIKRTYGLTQNEYNYALGSVEVGDNGNIATNVITNLYLASLDIGIKIVFRFVVTNVPPALIGKTSATDDSIVYDFTEDCSEPTIAEIVICDDNH